MIPTDEVICFRGVSQPPTRLVQPSKIWVWDGMDSDGSMCLLYHQFPEKRDRLNREIHGGNSWDTGWGPPVMLVGL